MARFSGSPQFLKVCLVFRLKTQICLAHDGILAKNRNFTNNETCSDAHTHELNFNAVTYYKYKYYNYHPFTVDLISSDSQ